MNYRFRLFLSYSNTDCIEECTQFENSFTADTAWRDRSRLDGGEKWRVTARDLIRKCDVVIAFMTPHAVESEAVLWEWKTALEYGKKLVPVLAKPSTVPDFLPRDLIRLDLAEPNLPTRIADELRNRWNAIERGHSDLQSALLRDYPAAAQFFVEHLRSLRNLLDASPPAYPPEVFEVLLDIFENLIHQHPDIEPIVDQLVDKTYQGPPDWEQGAVFERQHDLYFRQLFSRMRAALPGLPLHVVVAAMTVDQARALHDRSALAGVSPELVREYDDFLALVDDPEWAEAYDDSAERWKPFDGSETLHELIRVAVDKVFERREVPERIIARYSDIRDVAGAESLRTDLRECCLVIVDPLSLRHPSIRKQYRDSNLGNSDRLPIVYVGANPRVFGARQSASEFVELAYSSNFDSRRRNLDPRCDEVFDRNRLLLFLGNQIPRAIQRPRLSRTGFRSNINRFEAKPR